MCTYAKLCGSLTIHAPSASELLIGLEVFTHHERSGCFKNEIDIATGSLKMGHGDL